MDSFLLYLVIFLVIIIPVMIMYRRHTVAKHEAEMRAERELQDAVLIGTKTMRGAAHNSKRQPMSDNALAARDRATLRKVETSTTNTPDDLMLLSGAHLASTTSVPTPMSNYDDDTRKIVGGGGTFDGGGSSGDWTPPAPSTPSRSSYDSDSGSSSSSSGSSSYDSGSSYSSSSSSDSSSSSSSSDSGSSSSSSD